MGNPKIKYKCMKKKKTFNLLQIELYEITVCLSCIGNCEY